MDGGGSYQSFQKLGRSSSAGIMIPISAAVAGNNGLHQDLNPTQPGPMPNPNQAQPAPAVREQDRFMPIANVIRIMRKVLPTHAKISDDAKETIQECVSEYISFITSEANERCQQEQRKTITAEDVLWAMSKLGFDDYIEPLSIYLQRYREVEGDHRGSIRGENLPPIKRSAADMASCHMFAPPPSAYAVGPHPHHPYMYGGLMGGGFYRAACDAPPGTSHGGVAPPPGAVGANVLPLPPQGMQAYDPYGNGGYK